MKKFVKKGSAHGRQEKRPRSAHRQDGPREYAGRESGKVGPVTIYKRGGSYYLYYRENGKTKRPRIDGNLAAARATAGEVVEALTKNRLSPISYDRTSPEELTEAYLKSVAEKLAWRTHDRYRAALQQFVAFARQNGPAAIDLVDEQTVEEFVSWLRQQRRARNGSASAKQGTYKTGGIKFILNTCRTAFYWAKKRRMLRPDAENPFSGYGIDSLYDEAEEERGEQVFDPDQERAFFTTCSDWQRGLFQTLASYGMRVGELTHLLIEDVDLKKGIVKIRSKPELFWTIKTKRKRDLPLTDEMKELFENRIGTRKAGFVFLNEPFFSGAQKPCLRFETPRAFREHLAQIAEQVAAEHPQATDRQKRRAVVAFCRTMGQIPEKRVRNEFIKLTKQIGCPEFTRVHSLRHLFSSRAQENGINPLLVQQILGHASLQMTQRYTHLGLEAQRQAIERLNRSQSEANTQ